MATTYNSAGVGRRLPGDEPGKALKLPKVSVHSSLFWGKVFPSLSGPLCSVPWELPEQFIYI